MAQDSTAAAMQAICIGTSGHYDYQTHFHLLERRYVVQGLMEYAPPISGIQNK